MWRAQHAVGNVTQTEYERGGSTQELQAWLPGCILLSGGKTYMKTSRYAARAMALLLVALAALGIASSALFAQAAPGPGGIDGVWQGTLGSGPGQVLIVLTIYKRDDGKYDGILTAATQNLKVPMENLALQGDAVRFELKIVGGVYQGTLSKDGRQVAGTWTQSGGPAQPLVFAWQSAAPAKPAAPKLTPAAPPVALADLKSVLDREFAPVLEHGVLAASTGGGVVIGVYDHGQTRIFAYGTAQPDSIFEIGSITKTFTGLILAQMVEQKKLALDDPVRTLLPDGTVAKPDGPEITLLDLATQHSGLPRMPDNFHPLDVNDPYATYHAAQMYEFIGKRGVARPKDPGFLYSNFGFGLLGQALSLRGGVPYAQLAKSEITGPLHMDDTVITLSPTQQTRLIQGYDVADKPAGRWNLDAFAGAGALVSTAADMLKYLEANLHPEKLAPGAPADSPLSTLPAALALDHQPRNSGIGDLKIALAWACNDREHIYFHDGGTGGYSSFASFMVNDDRAIVVLYNREDTSTGNPFTARVFANIVTLMSGEPSLPLD
jgi:CubicO group peptidase (beta-lactamase class C family)